MTNRQTDRPRYSVGNNRPRSLRSTAMLSNNDKPSLYRLRSVMATYYRHTAYGLRTRVGPGMYTGVKIFPWEGAILGGRDVLL